MEIIIFIIVAVIFYIVVLPFIKIFGSNSEHKDSGKIRKTKEAFKQVGQNSKATLKATESGLNALNRGLDDLNKYLDKVNEDLDKYNQKHKSSKNDSARDKIDWIMLNERHKKHGLKELSYVEFLAQRSYDSLQKRNYVKPVKLRDEKEFQRELDKIYKLREARKTISINLNLQKNQDEIESQQNLLKINIQPPELTQALIEFIYIRYYLTGEKSLPQLKCIYESWAKTPYAETELNEEVWGKIIEKMSFDEKKCKKIDALYHFTHKDNLLSILTKGLLTKKTLDEQQLEYKYNDENRWDGVTDSVSLSFSHPNFKMFSKYSRVTGKADWIVLKISPELLTGNKNSNLVHLGNYDYLDKAIFNKFNAASFSVKNLSIEERKTHKAFLDMFESNIGMTLETYTFDNQAEILYQGNIPKDFIQEIHVIEEDPHLSWVYGLGFKVSINKTVFEKR